MLTCVSKLKAVLLGDHDGADDDCQEAGDADHVTNWNEHIYEERNVKKRYLFNEMYEFPETFLNQILFLICQKIFGSYLWRQVFWPRIFFQETQ